MDNRSFEAGAAASAPSAPASPSSGYPTNGNPSGATPATKPGEYWFHQIGEEIRAVIVAAGLTASRTVLTQLRDALIGAVSLSNPEKFIRLGGLFGGLTFQFGITTGSASADTTVTFATPFLTDCYVCLPVVQSNIAGASAQLISAAGLTSFTFAAYRNDTNVRINAGVNYLAIGR
jgi:hypothetical protein